MCFSIIVLIVVKMTYLEEQPLTPIDFTSALPTFQTFVNICIFIFNI